MAGSLRGRGEGDAKWVYQCTTKEKRTFFNVGKKFLWPLSRAGGGLKALVAGPLRKDFFCGFPDSLKITTIVYTYLYWVAFQKGTTTTTRKYEKGKI